MKTIVRENTWLNNEFCPHGWGNGYVLIPKGHPLHGKEYDFINQFVHIHGGLTFAEKIEAKHLDTWPQLTADDVGKWMVGFDTCHFDDTIQKWPKERVIEHTEELKNQLLNYKETMEREFMAAINEKAEQLKQRLLADALKDFKANYQNTGLTTTDCKELAKEYTNMFLAQELSLKLTVGMTKHMKA